MTNINNATQQCRLSISSNGRIVIPAQFRKAANLKEGDEILLFLQDDKIQIQPMRSIIEEAQTLVAQHFSEDDLMKDLKILRTNDAKKESAKAWNK